MAATVDVAEPHILYLGDGIINAPGAISMDGDPVSSPDIVHGIDDLPFPFADGRFDEVVGCRIVERSADPMALMAELHRITRAGGLVKLTALHWTNPEFASDLRNRNHLSSYSFRNLTLDRVVY
ncbi:MAG TPA: methyltransferase domain-containing protein, partial [Blastocatellia bacterium]|nr:methyltransferase domain-containing protein [Blastocatellia bacterium]